LLFLSGAGPLDGPLGVVADLVTGTATDSYGGSDTFSGFENLAGSKNDDQLFGDAAPGSLAFYGGRRWHKFRAAAPTLEPYLFTVRTVLQASD
jgi:hypothetical protein